MRLELGHRFSDVPAVRRVQRAIAWEGPRFPETGDLRVPRWSAGPTWTPPGTILLVRHRSLDGARTVVTNDRNPPEGFAIEYDIGLVHCFAQPGTRRLVATAGGEFFSTPFEGELADGLTGLGYVEEAPLPLLDALHVRREPVGGGVTLVGGPDDPLAGAEPLAHLGFVESYPVNPRRAPGSRVTRHFDTLVRRVDAAAWRHRYDVNVPRGDGVVSLGALWRRPSSDFVALRLRSDGTLVSELLESDPATGIQLLAAARWVGAPLGWAGRPRAWALRAAASRARAVTRLAPDAGNDAGGNGAGEQTIGYLRRDPLPRWSRLFSARHPVLGDQYVTRSELEARDMGYVVEGILGYIGDWSADRSPADHAHEVKWASRFGQTRRYVEGPYGS
ncbi:MAG TPA: hypothetical protein VN635_04510 [Conexibacter sp.]|nr:hypothetical protein [Conexibacter sp.]